MTAEQSQRATAAALKVALVTGGSRGIGRSISIELARKGVVVAVNFVQDRQAAEELLACLVPAASTQQRHAVFQADVADPLQCKTLIDQVVRCYGRLDILVNNAGICPEHDVLAVDYDAWQKLVSNTLATNFFGASNLSFLAIQQFVAQDKAATPRAGDRIVNVTSRAAYRGELTAAAYAASKAALSILGQSFARRLGPEGIYVYTVAPGWVETDMAREVIHGPQEAEILAQHPLGRVTTPEEVAKEVAWLACEAPPAMTGSVIDLNGASYLR